MTWGTVRVFIVQFESFCFCRILVGATPRHFAHIISSMVHVNVYYKIDLCPIGLLVRIYLSLMFMCLRCIFMICVMLGYFPFV